MQIRTEILHGLKLTLLGVALASPLHAAVESPAPVPASAPQATSTRETLPQTLQTTAEVVAADTSVDPQERDTSDDDPAETQSDDWLDHYSSGHHRHHGQWHTSNDDVVAIGHDAVLGEGGHANSVVAVFGSATSAGEVGDSIVAVFGNVRTTGRVRNSAVAVLGRVFVNGRVDGDVVAVFGGMELGPQADIRGNLVVVGGDLVRDAHALVRGGVNQVFSGFLGDFDWLRTWMQRCLLYGRPLAFTPGIAWAWQLALGVLALYAFVACVFHRGVERCTQTLERYPGQSGLAALLIIFLTPLAFLLLIITVLGIVAIPFVMLLLLGAAMFGKVVLLASVGRRCTPFLAGNPVVHTVVGVLVGGAIVLALYTIPIVGFIVYKVLGLLGAGVVFYTLLLSIRQSRSQGPDAATPDAGGPKSGTFAAGDAGATGPSQPAAATGLTAGSGFAASAPGARTASALTAPRAGFWIRMGALLLDVLILAVLLHQADGWLNLELTLLAVYGAVMWKLKGSTIGGIICGLQVVRLDGRVMDWTTAIVRALSCFLSLLCVGLGFLWISIDPEGQAWHDKIAGTVVVRAPKGASLL